MTSESSYGVPGHNIEGLVIAWCGICESLLGHSDVSKEEGSLLTELADEHHRELGHDVWVGSATEERMYEPLEKQLVKAGARVRRGVFK